MLKVPFGSRCLCCEHKQHSISHLEFPPKCRYTSHMNANHIRKLLRDACTAHGGESGFARHIGVSAQLINAVLRGAREPRGKVLDALGLEAVITYRRKKPVADASNKPKPD